MCVAACRPSGRDIRGRAHRRAQQPAAQNPGQQRPLPATHAQDGETALPGHIYVAPPDHHMLLEENTIRLNRGPKENHTRPAIDPCSARPPSPVAGV
jgi:chemotaxis response regulator CheB